MFSLTIYRSVLVTKLSKCLQFLRQTLHILKKITDEAMGNVASAVLMYALEAAWVFQRLIDQDYRQNHGGRLKPLTSLKNEEEVTEVFLPNGSSTPILSRSPHHHSKPASQHHGAKHLLRHTTRHKKTQSEPFVMSKPRKHRLPQPSKETVEVEPAPICACPTKTDTVHWVSCHARSSGATLRRAFSDINLPRHTKDHSFLKLIVSRGYTSDNDDAARQSLL